MLGRKERNFSGVSGKLLSRKDSRLILIRNVGKELQTYVENSHEVYSGILSSESDRGEEVRFISNPLVTPHRDPFIEVKPIDSSKSENSNN